MNVERVERALKSRALFWHKATSFRVKPDYEAHTKDETSVGEDGKVAVFKLIDHTGARSEAQVATEKLRRSFWNLAIDAGKTLVRVLVEETEEQRPLPLESFVYDGFVYKLQSVNGETQRYVKLIHHNENAVHIRPITHAERIEKELLSMREMSAANMLATLTPSEQDEE